MSISLTVDILEVIKYYKYKNIDFTFLQLKEYKNHYKLLPEKNEILDNIHKHYNINPILLENIYDYNIATLNNKKYNLIYYSIIFIKDGHLIEHYNIFNVFVGLFYGLTYTMEGGNFMLNMNNIINKAYADIFIIAKQHFNEAHLYYAEEQNRIKRSGAMAIFKGFKGGPEVEDTIQKLTIILKKMISYGMDNIYNFKLNDPTLYEKYNYNPAECEKLMKKFGTRDFKEPAIYVNGFIDLKGYTEEESAKLYKEILDFNNLRYIEQYSVLEKVIEMINKGEDCDKPTPERIQKTALYCKKWNLEYTYELKEKHINTLLTDLYKQLEPIYFKFKTNNTTYLKHLRHTIKNIATTTISIHPRRTQRKTSTRKISFRDMFNEMKEQVQSTLGTPKGKDMNIIAELDESNNDLVRTTLYIDTRRDFSKANPDEQIRKYDMAKTKFRFYKPEDVMARLSTLLVKRLGMGEISQAYLKMWEILTDCDIIPHDLTTLTTFHICEAPGMFIKAINHFVFTNKKHRSIQKYIWNSSSLHPSIAKIKDTYGLIRKYKNNWHFGIDGTGDITKLANIHNFVNLAASSQLITSDCGLEYGDPKYHQVAVASLIALILMAPRGANILYKILAPIDIPLIWNIIYIAFTTFQKLEFYKPLQNTYSREFYIIGKSFGGIDDATRKTLEMVVANLDNKKIDIETFDLFDGALPSFFVLQVVEFNKEFAQNFKNTIYKQLYYTDYYDELSAEFKKYAHDYVVEKNNEWMEKYKITKLPREKDI